MQRRPVRATHTPHEKRASSTAEPSALICSVDPSECNASAAPATAAGCLAARTAGSGMDSPCSSRISIDSLTKVRIPRSAACLSGSSQLNGAPNSVQTPTHSWSSSDQKILYVYCSTSTTRALFDESQDFSDLVSLGLLAEWLDVHGRLARPFRRLEYDMARALALRFAKIVHTQSVEVHPRDIVRVALDLP